MRWSERGCPIKRSSLPGVRAHDATNVFTGSGETDLVISLRHLVRAPPCRARVRRRAHPLSSVYILMKRL